MDNNLKVASASNPNSIAGMIAALVKEGSEKIKLQCVGAGAVNQGIKAVIIARGYLIPVGYDICIKPAFDIVNIESNDRTAISLIVEVV